MLLGSLGGCGHQDVPQQRRLPCAAKWLQTDIKCSELSTVCKLGALQRQVDLQGVFVKIGDLLNLKVSCGILREKALLRKSKTSRKLPEKWTFLSLAFYNAPSWHTVEITIGPKIVAIEILFLQELMRKKITRMALEILDMLVLLRKSYKKAETLKFA